MIDLEINGLWFIGLTAKAGIKEIDFYKEGNYVTSIHMKDYQLIYLKDIAKFDFRDHKAYTVVKKEIEK